jgi:hypothetical protein
VEDSKQLRDELSKLKEFLRTVEIVPVSYFAQNTKILMVSYQEFDKIKDLLCEFQSKD